MKAVARDDAWYRRTLHIAWAQLAAQAGMSKDDYEPVYRDILRMAGAPKNACGKFSLSGMTTPQKEKAIALFKERGFNLKKPRKTAQKPALNPVKSVVYQSALLDKAFGIWQAMAGMGIIKSASQNAFETWALKRITAEHLKWSSAGEQEQLVEALKLWARRKGAKIVYHDKDSWIEKDGEVA